MLENEAIQRGFCQQNLSLLTKIFLAINLAIISKGFYNKSLKYIFTRLLHKATFQKQYGL